MSVTVFANCVFFLKVKHLRIQEKNRLRTCIEENGGIIYFVLNHECTHVIVDEVAVLSSYHLKTIQKYQIPIVNADFVWKSAEEGKLLEIDDCEPSKSLEDNSDQKLSSYGGESHSSSEQDIKEKQVATEKNGNYDHDPPPIDVSQSTVGPNVESIRFYTENDRDIPHFPQDFEVAKYTVLEKVNTGKGKDVVVIELQCSQESCEFPFRISAHFSMSDGHRSKKKFIVTKTSEEVRENYEIYVEDLKNQGFLLGDAFLPGADYLASTKLQELLLEEAINSSSLSQEISAFVELIWAEALGHLEHLLLEPVNKISLNDVSKGEGILLRIKNAMKEGTAAEELKVMMMEFYRIIRHKSGIDYNITKKLLSSKQDLCQLIRDMLNVCETSMSSPNPPSLAKYRALRCKLQAIHSNSEEFLNVKQQVLKNNHSDYPVKILQIYRVGRISETAKFLSSLGNVQSLFHASSVRNFVGILSRGLLLPKMVVEDHGMERTDIGNLGSGIYFSDSISTSIKYSPPSEKDGTRLLVICNVALGTCLDLYKKDLSLTNAPSGYDSVHGVRKTANMSSDFEDDEFVVYKTCQVKMRYIVQFCLAGDQVKQFQPGTETELEQDQPASLHCHLQPKDYVLPDVNLLNHIKAGLQDTSGNPVPLEDIHIKGRIIDFIAQVIVFQTYINQNDNPIEAKYVFPLDDTAAVCGFEAFINDKHIIGEVKEKEQAHKEYYEAVSRGDGAYLMDQDAPDVFTVSVGNLPSKTTVVIKITYITELHFQNGCITFQMPAAVAPWQQDKALNENTQDTVKKVCVKQIGTKKGGFCAAMSIEMPYTIERVHSWTHKLKIKKTDCKAVIRTVENSSLDISGFALEIWISQVYLPRMWVEKHPDKESEACMLVFQPKFETTYKGFQESGEIIICLDCSNSMEGSTLQQAKQIALHALKMSCFRQKVNVVRFGTNFTEFSSYSKNITSDLSSVEEFITSATPAMGNTDFWKTLRYLSLLYPSQRERNILLISDGHLQNESVTLQVVKENVGHTRLFACGVGSRANHHMLRSLSQYGAGAYEYFDPKSKYNWLKKIESQTSRIFSPGCSSVSIKWQHFDANAPEPLQAPAQIQSLFNNERLLVYGFIPHCTQATLNALINDQELQAMVSTTELQKTTGTLLHKLTARALIRDYEDGILHENEMEHEMKKHTLKALIINLSMENSIITQFTSFVAIEKRDVNEDKDPGVPNILELIDEEDVDFLPYMDWEHEPSGHGHLSYNITRGFGMCELVPSQAITNLFSDHILTEEDEQLKSLTFKSDKEYSLVKQNASPDSIRLKFGSSDEVECGTGATEVKQFVSNSDEQPKLIQCDQKPFSKAIVSKSSVHMDFLELPQAAASGIAGTGHSRGHVPRVPAPVPGLAEAQSSPGPSQESRTRPPTAAAVAAAAAAATLSIPIPVQGSKARLPMATVALPLLVPIWESGAMSPPAAPGSPIPIPVLRSGARPPPAAPALPVPVPVLGSGGRPLLAAPSSPIPVSILGSGARPPPVAPALHVPVLGSGARPLPAAPGSPFPIPVLGSGAKAPPVAPALPVPVPGSGARPPPAAPTLPLPVPILGSGARQPPVAPALPVPILGSGARLPPAAPPLPVPGSGARPPLAAPVLPLPVPILGSGARPPPAAPALPVPVLGSGARPPPAAPALPVPVPGSAARPPPAAPALPLPVPILGSGARPPPAAPALPVPVFGSGARPPPVAPALPVPILGSGARPPPAAPALPVPVLGSGARPLPAAPGSPFPIPVLGSGAKAPPVAPALPVPVPGSGARPPPAAPALPLPVLGSGARLLPGAPGSPIPLPVLGSGASSPLAAPALPVPVLGSGARPPPTAPALPVPVPVLGSGARPPLAAPALPVPIPILGFGARPPPAAPALPIPITVLGSRAKPPMAEAASCVPMPVSSQEPGAGLMAGGGRRPSQDQLGALRLDQAWVPYQAQGQGLGLRSFSDAASPLATAMNFSFSASKLPPCHDEFTPEICSDLMSPLPSADISLKKKIFKEQVTAGLFSSPHSLRAESPMVLIAPEEHKKTPCYGPNMVWGRSLNSALPFSDVEYGGSQRKLLNTTNYSRLRCTSTSRNTEEEEDLVLTARKTKQLGKRVPRLMRIQRRPSVVPWTQIFELQHQDGFWNLSPELGDMLDLDVDYLTNIFLAKKGIWSLGPKGKEVLQLIATLLVLQFIRYKQPLEGITFKSLMKLDDSPTSSSIHWAFASLKKAVEWVRRVDGQFPAICHRLELGKDWDSATKKLLGIKLSTDFLSRI